MSNTLKVVCVGVDGLALPRVIFHQVVASYRVEKRDFRRTFQAVDACMYSQAENVDSDEGMLHLIWHLVRFSLHTRSRHLSRPEDVA